jgi:hypothetical protein
LHFENVLSSLKAFEDVLVLTLMPHVDSEGHLMQAKLSKLLCSIRPSPLTGFGRRERVRMSKNWKEKRKHKGPRSILRKYNLRTSHQILPSMELW